MTLSRRRFLEVIMAATATPARGDSSSTWHGQALGARVSITARGPYSDRLTRDASAIRNRLRDLETIFSLYRPDSALSRLNATGELAQPPAELVSLLRTSVLLHQLTGGLFNPAVQRRWLALASGDAHWAEVPIGKPDDLTITDDYISLGPDPSALTLNGIAQGFASDDMAALIRSLGYDLCLVNVGEYVAVGDDWRIGVAGSGGRILHAVTLSDRAVATSSASGMNIRGRSHILHPSGSIRPRWETASVIADNAALADGLSTALIHMQPPAVAALTGRTPAGAVDEITLEDARGDIWRVQPPAELPG